MTKSGEEKAAIDETTTRDQAPQTALTPAARRALAEAQARRDASAARTAPAAEIGGRGGLDPARYGDWEVKGVASDF